MLRAAPACARSRIVNDYQGSGINAVVTITDYLGLGPNGQLHAYLSGPSAVRAMIDGVRAARALTRGKTSRRWIASGASQGGHAALFVGEQAPRYARELDLMGVVAVEPSSEATGVFPGDDPVLTTAVEVMSLYGRAVDQPALAPDDYVSAATAQSAKQLRTVCLADAVASFAAIPSKDVWKKDPKQAEPLRSIVEESVPGRVKTSAPILLVQGGADVVVTPARTQAFLERACGIGNRVEFRLYPAGAHPTAPGLAKADIGAWLQERRAGHPAQTDCPVASRR